MIEDYFGELDRRIESALAAGDKTGASEGFFEGAMSLGVFALSEHPGAKNYLVGTVRLGDRRAHVEVRWVDGASPYERLRGHWDKHGRLWGHEWAAVAWMALAIAEARDDSGAVLLDPSVIRRWVTENLMSESDRDRMVYQGLE